ncbi:MAG: hypothetical protein ACJ76P_06890 [Actinomycetota bacterium]
MEQDALLTRLEELERACVDVDERLHALRRAAQAIRVELESGRPLSEIVATGPGPRARRDVRESWSALNRKLHEYRVAMVKRLVDGEGMTIADAARITGNARQVISRLYHG